MKISLTLSRYFASTYLINTLSILLGLLSIIYLFDTIELIRRAGNNADISLTLILQMSLLKLPEVGQILFPFAILFSALLSLWQLNRRSELVVLRAAGYSVWQFLLPLIALASIIGALQITIINPLGALFIGKYEQLENRYLNRQNNEIALFQGGLWLRQNINQLPESLPKHLQTRQNLSEGYVILHARSIDQKNWELKNLTALYFGQQDTFLMRMDAQKASLSDGYWIFQNALLTGANGQKTERLKTKMPTSLSQQDIEESFASPETMSFWKLSDHIKTLEKTGFDTSRLKVHYHNLLSQPLLLAAMVILAATVAMRPPRSGGTFLLFSLGILIGFLVFFISSYLQAMGYSGQLPPALAAWSPSILCVLIGLSTMMHLEDG